MDICKIAPGLYQYTAIDDCRRDQVLALFSQRNAESTLEFPEKCQTNHVGKFFAQEVQKRLLDYRIKFRPTKPVSPQLNGKV